MSPRTASLLMLFVAALGVTGVLLAIAVRTLDGTEISGPWLAPTIAVLCQTIALYWGRWYVLPQRAWDSRARTAVVLATVVALTMAVAVAMVRSIQWIAGAELAIPSLTLPLWFALLWLIVSRGGFWSSRHS